MNSVTVLCISTFFSAWGDRLWDFAVGLYLIKLTPGSFQLAAIYGLTLTAVGILFSPMVGNWIDRTNRLKVVRFTLILQNTLVIFCALVVLIYLHQVTYNIHLLRFMQAMIILFGALANLAGQGQKISVTKDWIVVICSRSREALASANALLRRIDLFVAITAPIGVGLLMTVISDLAGILFVCCWNVLSMFAEFFLLRHLYRTVPDLSHKANVDGDEMNDPLPNGSTKGATSSITEPFPTFSFMDRLRKFYYGWKIYWDQTVLLAGIGLAILYLSVLGFNAITTSYAYSQGLKEVYVSICFGCASLVGVSATFLFPFLRRKIGLQKTGILGNILQLSMLLLCVFSIWLPGSPSGPLEHTTNGTDSSSKSMLAKNSSLDLTTLKANYKSVDTNISIIVFMVGIILSRAGLWIFDLSITQLQQENVSEEERGTVGGVQYALNSLFDLLHFLVTICLPNPSQFWILILMSVSAVIFCIITYIIYSAKHTLK